jgi:purine-binding chemotaxis protein CheW
MPDDNRKVLTFSLGAETYGVDILRVKEIRGWSPVTRIPHSASFVLGVLNLRGVVVPVIDLRLRLGLAAAEITAITVIIVLSLHGVNGPREVGVLVDRVNDVVDIEAQSIKPAPPMTGTVADEFVEGIVAREQMLILLDSQCLASNDPISPATASQAA